MLKKLTNFPFNVPKMLVVFCFSCLRINFYCHSLDPAIQLKLISVWIYTGIFTFSTIKGVEIIFFYDKFNSGVSTYIVHLKENKKAYVKLVVVRAILAIFAIVSALYFAGVFGNVVY